MWGRHARVVSRSQDRSGGAWRRVALRVLPLLVVLAGCASWVELTDAGREVKVARPDEVAGCRKVGTTQTKVLDRVFFIDRPATRVALELTTLARNEAPRLAGNTIVPTTPIYAGAQTYDIFRCDP